MLAALAYFFYCGWMADGLDSGGYDALAGVAGAGILFVVCVYFGSRRKDHLTWHKGRLLILWAVVVLGLLTPLKPFVFPLVALPALLTWFWLPDRRA